VGHPEALAIVTDRAADVCNPHIGIARRVRLKSCDCCPSEAS
jgi:hypothetical protein